jgi:hypothetical protein
MKNLNLQKALVTFILPASGLTYLIRTLHSGFNRSGKPPDQEEGAPYSSRRHVLLAANILDKRLKDSHNPAWNQEKGPLMDIYHSE